MNQFVKIVLFFLAYYLIALATGQKTKPPKCSAEDRNNPLTKPVPSCTVEEVSDIDGNAKGAKPCCKWTGDTRSVRCCASYSTSGGGNNKRLDDPVCLPGYSITACLCKPMPNDLTTSCTNSTYYGQPAAPKNRPGVAPCCASGLGLCCEKKTTGKQSAPQCPPKCFTTAQCATP